MPAFLLGIHRKIAFGKIKCHLFCFSFINMDTLEAFQQF